MPTRPQITLADRAGKAKGHCRHQTAQYQLENQWKSLGLQLLHEVCTGLLLADSAARHLHLLHEACNGSLLPTWSQDISGRPRWQSKSHCRLPTTQYQLENQWKSLGLHLLHEVCSGILLADAVARHDRQTALAKRRAIADIPQRSISLKTNGKAWVCSCYMKSAMA